MHISVAVDQMSQADAIPINAQSKNKMLTNSNEFLLWLKLYLFLPEP